MNEIVKADLLMVPRNGMDPKFVSGVLVQLNDGHPVVSIFTRYEAEAEQLRNLGNIILFAMRASC